MAALRGARAVGGRQFERFEQNFGKLLGGIQVEGITNRFDDLLFQLDQFLLQLDRHLIEKGHVQGDPGLFHARQHRHERHFDLIEQLRAIHLFQFCLHQRQQAQGIIGISRGIRGGQLDGHVGHADLALAFADQLLDVGHGHAQVDLRHVLEAQAVRGRVCHPFGDHRIEAYRADLQAILRQHQPIVLEVVADLGFGRVGHCRAQRIDHLRQPAVGRDRRDAPPGCNSLRPLRPPARCPPAPRAARRWRSSLYRKRSGRRVPGER